MANLTAVTVELNVQGEREATSALQRFKSEQDRLSTSVIGSARKLESINSRWAEADRLLAKGTIGTKAHAAAQKQLGRELAVLNNMYDDQNRLMDVSARNQLKNAQAVRVAQQAQAQYNKRLDEIRMRLDPVYRATKNYNASLRELDTLLESTDLSAAQHAQMVRQLKQEYDKVALGGRGARRSMNNVNIAVQQAGFQVSDFAIQVQSGTNAFVAFSQQASQLVGVLPLVANDIGLTAGKAIALSSGLALAIPLLTVAGSVLLETARGAKKAGDEVESLSSVLDEATTLFERAKSPVEELTDRYGKFADEVKRAADIAARTALLDLGDKVASFNEKIREEGNLNTLIRKLGELRDAQKSLENAPENSRIGFAQQVAVLQLQVTSLTDKIGLSVLQAKDLNAALKNMSTATGPEEVAKSASDLLDFMREVEEQTGSVPPAFRPMIPLLEEAVRKGAALSSAIDGSADSASNLTNQFDRVLDKINAMSSGMRNFYSELRSGALDVQALEAKLNALQGGATESEASGKALRTQLMNTDVAREIMSSGSAGEQATFLANVNKRVATSVRASNLTDQISAFGRDSGGSGGGGGDSRERSASAYIQQLEREADLRRSLIGLSEEQRERAERRSEIQEKVSELEGTISKDRIQQLVNEEQQIDRLIEQEEERRANIEQLEGRFNSFFLSIHDDIGDLEDAFRNMLRSIIKDTFQRTVSEPISKSLGGLFGGLFSANGNAFNSQGVMAFADGGVVNSPTPFRFGSGGQPGVMGEAGPEAILPLSRGSNGKLGVQSSGGQVGGTATIRLVAPEGFTAMQEGRIQGIAVEVASEGLAEYDRSELPRSVERINKDPRLRG